MTAILRVVFAALCLAATSCNQLPLATSVPTPTLPPSAAASVASARPSADPVGSLVLGGDECFPPSPRTPTQTGSVGLLVGTPAAGTTTRLYIAVTPVLVSGQEWKLIVRMTGNGDLRFSASHTDGTTVTPHQLEGHTGNSSLDPLPGAEWGVFLTFPKSGCWKLAAVRGPDRADAWVLVIPPS